MATVRITTTPERLHAAMRELHNAWIGGEHGHLISEFMFDCDQATPSHDRPAIVMRMDVRGQFVTDGDR